VLCRFPVEECNVIPLGRLPREKVKRALVVARFNDDGRSFYVLAIHGAHISHGSYVQYRRVNAIAGSLDPSVPVLLGGDFNSWRPLLRVFLPGWRSMAKGRTWPAHHPHSQIDHIFARGPWIKRGSFTRDGGSDHLALIADVDLP
jgi:endonuclease/exonuclease/phosphatase (EEP) superfamily protein YafD